MDSYRSQLHRGLRDFAERLPSVIDTSLGEADQVPRAARALTLNRYAMSRRDRVAVRLAYINEALRMLDILEGREVGPTFLPSDHSRPSERRQRRAVPGG
jgi:hypothetical protein